MLKPNSPAFLILSPRYAREIRTPEGGYGMDGLLRARAGKLSGILNGVDYQLWSPERDPRRATAALTGGRVAQTDEQLRVPRLLVERGVVVSGGALAEHGFRALGERWVEEPPLHKAAAHWSEPPVPRTLPVRVWASPDGLTVAEPAPAGINYGVSFDTTRPGAYDHIEKHTIPKSYIP